MYASVTSKTCDSFSPSMGGCPVPMHITFQNRQKLCRCDVHTYFYFPPEIMFIKIIPWQQETTASGERDNTIALIGDSES